MSCLNRLRVLHAKVFLTFDVEDFINPASISALYRTLGMLRKYDLKGLFFITGYMAEKLSNFPKIIHLLHNHEIGYHSSAHSVRPTIPEYTDLESYEEAYLYALRRESSHIDLLTGQVNGKGGFTFLKDLFRDKEIVSFRAPGGCWTPPLIDALRNFGIKFDFSADISSMPVHHKDITFYPSSILIDQLRPTLYLRLVYIILNNRILVLSSHPNSFVNRIAWDSFYNIGNPKRISKVQQRTRGETKHMLMKLERLLKQIKFLQERKLIEVTPDLVESSNDVKMTKDMIQRSYERSVWWIKTFFGYEPKFLRNHFFRFFDLTISTER